MLACRRHDRCHIALLGFRHFPLAARRAGYITAADVTKCRDAAAAARRKPARGPLDAPGGPSGCGVSGRRARNISHTLLNANRLHPTFRRGCKRTVDFLSIKKTTKQAWL